MKKVLLFVLMITLIVSCAVAGVAFASDATSYNYTAKFTTSAVKTAPGYVIFDKPMDATDGNTITMTMDIESGTDLSGQFNLGFAILPNSDADALKDANSLVWYNSTISPSGKRNMGSIVISGTETTGNQASGLYYKTGSYITSGNTIKVEYVAPTQTEDGSIALYTKTDANTTWTLVNKYSSIKYTSMQQSDELYVAVMGWWGSSAQERKLSFLNPKATDGVNVSTSVIARGSVELTVPSEIENGNGYLLHSDKYAYEADVEKAESIIYYNHTNEINDGKLSTRAIVEFDVILNNGLQLVLNETKDVPGIDAVKIAVPVLEDENSTEVFDKTTVEISMKPTGRYELVFEERSVEGTPKTLAVLYAYYKVYGKATTEVEGADDVVVEMNTIERIEINEGVEVDFDSFYVGFMVETIDASNVAVFDNLHVMDDPENTGALVYDYRCKFEDALDENTFTSFVTGVNSVAQITSGAQTIAVTNGVIVDKEGYTLLIDVGDIVVLKADEAPKGHHFDRWEKADGSVYSKSEEISIMVAYNLALTAKYELDDHVVTIINNTGKITFYEGANVDLTTKNVKYGDSVKVEAYENNEEGYVFDGWYNGNDKVSSDEVFRFEVTTTYDRLEAKYALAQINLQVVNGKAKEVGTDDAIVNLTKEWGTQVVATPGTPKTGEQFDHWEFEGVKIDATLLGEGNTYTFDLKESGKLTAVFSKVQYQVTVTDGTFYHKDQQVSSALVNHGEQIVITANAPAEGKQFDGWYLGETKVSSDLDYVVTVDGAISVTAKYVDKTETTNSGCAGFIAPPTSNGGGNNSLWLVAGMLVLCVLAVAIARRNHTSKESK